MDAMLKLASCMVRGTGLVPTMLLWPQTNFLMSLRVLAVTQLMTEEERRNEANETKKGCVLLCKCGLVALFFWFTVVMPIQAVRCIAANRDCHSPFSWVSWVIVVVAGSWWVFCCYSCCVAVRNVKEERKKKRGASRTHVKAPKVPAAGQHSLQQSLTQPPV